MPDNVTWYRFEDVRGCPYYADSNDVGATPAAPESDPPSSESGYSTDFYRLFYYNPSAGPSCYWRIDNAPLSCAKAPGLSPLGTYTCDVDGPVIVS
jgi:hypothetical protein